MRVKYLLVVAVLVALFSNMVRAENVSIVQDTGIQATAYYRSGDANKPVVLILHGFLQTRNYLTLQNINQTVSENGYPLLAPTLSLGISNRKSSLACEAAHTHTMESDVAEIVQWLQWLRRKGHKQVILVGHSFGSVTLLAYLDASVRQQRMLPVKKYIAISLIDSEDAPNTSARDQAYTDARKLVELSDNSLQAYKLSYCKKYMSPAAAFLSYASWTSSRILKTLTGIASSVKVVAILGSKDQRVPAAWPNKLANTGITVSLVTGANHFFGGEHEFDLQDTLIQVLGDN